MNRFVALQLSAIMALTSGCASLVSGTRQQVPISSYPSGASVIVDGTKRGLTPMTVTLRRKDIHKITIEKTGFESYEIVTGKKTEPWIWGNFPLFYTIIPGVIVDLATGAGSKINPDLIRAELFALHDKTSTPLPDPSINAVQLPSADNDVSSLLKALQKLQQAGILSDEEYQAKRKATIEKL